MKILITGATGLIGKKLGLALTKKGHELFIVSRNRNQAEKNCPFPCTVIEGDLSHKPIPSESIPEVDAVINLMGESIATGRWTEEKKRKLRQSRIDGTQNLESSFQNKLPKLIISTSAIGIYGDRNSEVLNENSKPGKGFLSELCIDWEKAALSFESENTRVVIVRVGIVISKDGGALKEMLPIFRAGVGGPISDGNQWMSWIHIDDLINIFMTALENNNLKGPINAVAPNPVQNSEFTKTISEVIHKPAFFRVYATLLHLVLGEKAIILTASQKVHSTALKAIKFTFQYENLKKALQKELS